MDRGLFPAVRTRPGPPSPLLRAMWADAAHDDPEWDALTFSRTGDGFVDDETGSTWDIFGEAVDGPLEGEQLEAIAHLDTFWFAWAAFETETRIIPEEE